MRIWVWPDSNGRLLVKVRERMLAFLAVKVRPTLLVGRDASALATHGGKTV